MNIPKITKRFETSLASALSAAGSSFTLESATDEDGNALSGLYGMTIDVGSADVEDFLVTISGTTATVVYRGIDADAPNTEVTANKKAHRRGASVVVTDYPVLGVLRNILNGDESLPNKIVYASHPTFSADTDVVDKKYVDDTNNTGAANAGTTTAGLVEEATQAEVDARTTTGGTGAKLFAPLDKIRASLYHDYSADAGANDTYAVTITPAPTAYTAGMVVEFKANTVNTGACTLNVNALGAKSLKVNKDLDPQDGYIKAGAIVLAVYDGTNFQIQSVAGKPSVSQSGEEIYAASTSGNDTYAITVAPVPAAYVTGQRFYFKPDTANTGTATLNVNALGAKSVLRPDGSALADGDIAANQIVGVAYDGTNMLMISPIANSPKYTNGTATKDASDASTTQNIAHGLGRAPRCVRIKAIAEASSGSGDSIPAISETVYNGTTQSSVSFYATGTGFSGGGASVGTTFVLNIAGASGTQTGVVTVDATNIIITWTKANSPTGTYTLLWGAEA